MRKLEDLEEQLRYAELVINELQNKEKYLETMVGNQTNDESKNKI